MDLKDIIERLEREFDEFVRSKGLYLVAAVMLAIVFLVCFFIYGFIVLGIRPSDFLGLIAGGIAATLAIALLPYATAKINEIRKAGGRRKRRAKRKYSIYLLTDKPPERDIERLKVQAERIDVIISDLKKMCSECLSRKCGKCRIKREIIPTLEKVKRSLK